MAKNFDATFDAGLNAMKAGAIRVAVCSSQPANYGAIAAATLGTVTISSTDFTGPADHTTGRKLTFNGKDVTISTGGTVTHLVFHDNSAVLWGGHYHYIASRCWCRGLDYSFLHRSRVQ